MVSTFNSLLIYALFQKLVVTLMVNFQKNFQCRWKFPIHSKLGMNHLLSNNQYTLSWNTFQWIIDEIFINFSLIIYKKSLNIHDDKEEGFSNNIN